jgi:hypothetical protein
MVTSDNHLRRMFIHILVKFELKIEPHRKNESQLNENLLINTEYDLLKIFHIVKPPNILTIHYFLGHFSLKASKS